MNSKQFYATDYITARGRFRDAAERLGWDVRSYPLAVRGANAEELTIDLAISAAASDAEVASADLDDSSHDTKVGGSSAVIVSSGVHGVEGFFGSAVQLAWLQQRLQQTAPIPSTRIVMIHAVNPYGFSHLRRFDENNVDLNRNFLLAGEPYSGAPEGYAELNDLLNPSCAPKQVDLFWLKAIVQIARHGLPALHNVIAAGQYDFPRGLFFGGQRPSESNEILADKLPRILSGVRRAIHLDLHSGLGPKGACKLLVHHSLTEKQRQLLAELYGAETIEDGASSSIAYQPSGDFGRWCTSSAGPPDYIYACAEYGTYPSPVVLNGLRLENQSHHYGDPASRKYLRGKRRLKDLFCPDDSKWRETVVGHGVDLIHRAVAAYSAT